VTVHLSWDRRVGRLNVFVVHSLPPSTADDHLHIVCISFVRARMHHSLLRSRAVCRSSVRNNAVSSTGALPTVANGRPPSSQLPRRDDDTLLPHSPATEQCVCVCTVTCFCQALNQNDDCLWDLEYRAQNNVHTQFFYPAESCGANCHHRPDAVL
jgi:hypothetical protein